MAITTLLLTAWGAVSAPVAVAINPGMTGMMAKKMPKQDDKEQAAVEDVKETEARKPQIDEEVSVAENIFKRPIRDAKVQFKIDGYSQLDVGMPSQIKTKQDKNESNETSSTPYMHIGATKLKFEASVKTNKMVAGWLMRFHAQPNETGIDRNGIFWKHDAVGQVDAGNIRGVDDSLFKFAQRLIGGSNGWDSGLPYMFTLPTTSYYCEGTNFIGSPDTGTKVSYITPKVGDVFTFALSYTPNTSHRGNVAMTGADYLRMPGSKVTNSPRGFADKDKDATTAAGPVGLNNVVMVVNLDKKCGDWSFGGAFAYIHDSSEIWYDKKRYSLNDTNTFGVSGEIGYGKFKLGVEYMNNGKSRLPVDDTLSKLNIAPSPKDGEKAKEIFGYGIENGYKGHAGHVITSTLQYKWTDRLVSAMGYQWTYRKLNEESNTTRHTWSNTLNFLFMPGLEGYIEGDMIWLKRKDNGKENEAASNTGFVCVAGVRAQI